MAQDCYLQHTTLQRRAQPFKRESPCLLLRHCSCAARYYGMSAKEEAAHVRQVKRFAKGLFANVLGDADRCAPFHQQRTLRTHQS